MQREAFVGVLAGERRSAAVASVHAASVKGRPDGRKRRERKKV